MSLTPGAQDLKPQRLDEVLKSIDLQVRRDVDSMRAKHYWETTLLGTPNDVLVEALTMALASGRYQMTPRGCPCCRNR
ncbi:hypothetical protein GGD92_06070 [Pseudomonas protegens]|uniref:Uncharacterized protein n=1 Tax=Pseudomonas protegens TaxID=380021 RepID=A0A7G7XCY7_9PSED|nr:hypothetical protein [Pseudomonas protegens]QNH77832.1 hypothetical protein GGI48_01145 [Pseudomonas protegens]QNL07028.1 hypothetical protein GGD92_06070 [Pseudomonas protegens]